VFLLSAALTMQVGGNAESCPGRGAFARPPEFGDDKHGGWWVCGPSFLHYLPAKCSVKQGFNRFVVIVFAD
jgi:hypothetical protein